MRFVKKDLMKVADVGKARVLQGFFKTGVGQYGEGDVFLGVSVPEQSRIARKHWDRIDMDGVEGLFCSGVHEERLVALLILIEKYNHVGYDGGKEALFRFYLGNTKYINNWDLVDLSAPKIVGDWLLGKDDRGFLDGLAVSDSLWERRIAIVSTYAFIRAGEFGDTLRIAKMLLKDGHDLIHKAVGWMLREVGKRDADLLRKFLRENYSDLPRTTLRYAIERFSAEERKGWLNY